MIYSELVKKACNILYEASMDEMDKGGYPYVFHPFYLATQMEDEYTTCAALLHDVVEDHSDKYSFNDFLGMGFPSEVVDALKLLTHDESVPYRDYIRAIGENPIARKVKMADLKHNMDITRTDGRVPYKYETYKESLAYLEGLE